MSAEITDEQLNFLTEAYPRDSDACILATELLAARKRIAFLEEARTASFNIQDEQAARIAELEADRDRLEAMQANKWSAQWNARVQQWTVQETAQVVGCIGSGNTLREALDDARKEAL